MLLLYILVPQSELVVEIGSREGSDNIIPTSVFHELMHIFLYKLQNTLFLSSLVLHFNNYIIDQSSLYISITATSMSILYRHKPFV